MFSLIKKIPRMPNANKLFSILAGRYISSGEILQNSEQVNKVKVKERIGGLPSDLVNQQKLKKTSRTLSTLQNNSLPIATRLAVSPNESRDFMTLYPEYNITQGKKFRGLLTVLTYKNLVKDITPENLKLTRILGWCLELLQCFFILTDDIMDNSTTRRGQTCWHKLDNVGLVAFNDSIMLESSVYVLLKKYFSNLELKDAEAFRQTKLIAMEIGHFFQVQDDFLDCFGKPEVTGKLGTDIQDNKCSWLAVVCMQRANDNQKATMLECYGKNEPEKVARVKELYKTLGLPNTYADYEQESYNMIKTHIQQTSRGVPQETFLEILNKIHQRSA
uniref:Farnesyl pyrophosphate synthase n=1 Tax=Glossina brevipalpis TaxID=37001 RepID=A0A1A9WS63_9MUSC